MPRVCTVCSSPRRDEIDEAVTRGETFRRVAPRCGVSDRALRRHAAEHVPAAIVKAHAVAEETRADDLLSILREAVADARRLRGKAEGEGDYRAAIAAVKTLSDLVETLADIGERLAKGGAEGPVLLRVEWVNDWRPMAGTEWPSRQTPPGTFRSRATSRESTAGRRPTRMPSLGPRSSRS